MECDIEIYRRPNDIVATAGNAGRVTLTNWNGTVSESTEARALRLEAQATFDAMMWSTDPADPLTNISGYSCFGRAVMQELK